MVLEAAKSSVDVPPEASGKDKVFIGSIWQFVVLIRVVLPRPSFRQDVQTQDWYIFQRIQELQVERLVSLGSVVYMEF